MSPSPRPLHNIASMRLAFQLDAQLSREHAVVQDIDIDLERVQRDGDMLRASEVLIVVEVVSPSSKRMDTVVKHDDYADAGIPRYWIVDLDAPVSLVACHLAGEFGYQDAPAATGRFTTREPFPAELDLTRLTA